VALIGLSIISHFKNTTDKFYCMGGQTTERHSFFIALYPGEEREIFNYLQLS